jgi:hypothetical protein
MNPLRSRPYNISAARTLMKPAGRQGTCRATQEPAFSGDSAARRLPPALAILRATRRALFLKGFSRPHQSPSFRRLAPFGRQRRQTPRPCKITTAGMSRQIAAAG